MSRNATSSWSGYAHQGKVGLLVALRKINALYGTLPAPVLSDYILSYETQEDAKITHAGNVIEVHQVKAFQSSKTIGSYTSALAVFESCVGENYLHSICEITNWADLTVAQNPKAVTRYPYTAALNHCSLEDIYGYIDTEITVMLTNLSHGEYANPGWRENAFQEFLAILDEKIRYEHQHHDSLTYNIAFTLDEVVDIMVSPPAKFKSKISAIRKGLYGEYLRFIDDLESNELTPTPEHEVAVTNALEAIYRLSDKNLEQFLKHVNPHTTEGKCLDTCELTDSFFNSDSFYGTFLSTMIAVTETEYLLNKQIIPNYFKDSSYILTAIQSTEIQKKHHARSILRNDGVNFSGYETDFIITQNYSGELGACASKVTCGGLNPAKFCNPKTMQFISHADAVAKLNS